MSFNKVDPKLKGRIKNLQLVLTDRPQPELLITVPNPHPSEYEERMTYPEFTSLCPLAPSQPDYATITISYRPGKEIIELKSLKLYLVSYRNVEVFHEAVVGNILKDLVGVCSPLRMIITGKFMVRGGIEVVIESSYLS